MFIKELTCLHTNDIPVILMSACPRVFNSLGSYGCNSFILKPFNLDEIVECIYSLTNSPQIQLPC